MKRIFLAGIASLLALSLLAADTPKECALCVGSVTDLTAIPATPVPLVAKASVDHLAETGTALDAMTPAVRAKTTVVIGYGISNGLDDIEARTKAIIEWAKVHGPFDGLGISVEGADAAQLAYAIKRLAVMAQGQNVASHIVFPRAEGVDLDKLVAEGALPYIDVLFVDHDVKPAV